jgi:hypothetical protein
MPTHLPWQVGARSAPLLRHRRHKAPGRRRRRSSSRAARPPTEGAASMAVAPTQLSSFPLSYCHRIHLLLDQIPTPSSPLVDGSTRFAGFFVRWGQKGLWGASRHRGGPSLPVFIANPSLEYRQLRSPSHRRSCVALISHARFVAPIVCQSSPLPSRRFVATAVLTAALVYILARRRCHPSRTRRSLRCT